MREESARSWTGAAAHCRSGSPGSDFRATVKILIVAVGKPSPGPLADAIAAFETRAGRYWPLIHVTVRAEPARSRSGAEVRELEGQRILARASGTLVACHEGGVAMDSAAFARWLLKCRESARDLTFVIGGAHGLAECVLEQATRRLLLAPWTVSHDIARLLLAEQIYRAGTIVRGEPYHK
jgi:23S rRNA (pseudouridine1915-N3)-methyltransferase